MRYIAVTIIAAGALLLSLSTVYGLQKVDNLYFSLKVPDTWTYAGYSNT
jgi:hypothetical protein